MSWTGLESSVSSSVKKCACVGSLALSSTGHHGKGKLFLGLPPVAIA